MSLTDKPLPTASIDIEPLAQHTLHIPIVGITPLITNNWSAKAKQQMLDSQQGKAKAKKPPKNPEEDFRASLYVHEDGWYGMPSTAFKSAIADAARFFDKSITITSLKRSLFIEGEGAEQLVRIEGAEPTMRQDMVRNASGVADIRFRAQFDPWRAVLAVTYPTSMYTPGTVVALVDAAGNNGVGEWRPSAQKNNGGTYGRWKVASGDTFEEVSV
jgi:hypothetical protein